ncbi:MAG: hypothetical protein ABEN55_22790 [Bradymonadaceae bacterium]
MKAKALKQILVDRLEADRDGDIYELPEERNVSALLRTGGELLQIDKLRVLEFGDEATSLITKRSEYFVETTDVFALKLEGSRIQPHEAKTGFRRD